jgi:hypothetical protein
MFGVTLISGDFGTHILPNVTRKIHDITPESLL